MWLTVTASVSNLFQDHFQHHDAFLEIDETRLTVPEFLESGFNVRQRVNQSLLVGVVDLGQRSNLLQHYEYNNYISMMHNAISGRAIAGTDARAACRFTVQSAYHRRRYRVC